MTENPRGRRGVVAFIAILTLVLTALTPALADPGGNGIGHEKGNGRGSGLPPGLEKRAELPPGLANMDELPPGIGTSVTFELTLLHHNDGESQLLSSAAGEDFGGVARFATLVDELRTQAETDGDIDRGALLVSAGDNYLAGQELNASLEDPDGPFYDAIALDHIGYDALVIGNHEFDFGPDVFQRFVESFTMSEPPFLSANLDFTGEPGLQALVDAGRIAPSTVVVEDGRMIGIVGATTPNLSFISSPGGVVVETDVASVVQAEIDELTAEGVNIIVFVSHLQGLGEDLELIPQLSDVDIAVAGGGDELLTNEGDLLVPPDTFEDRYGPYPLTVEAADGAIVPIVTTPGGYAYVGRLAATFNANGELVGYEGGPVRVSGVEPDAVEADPDIQEEVVDPVAEYVAELEATVIGTSEVALEGRRPQIRVEETNLGNLMADALRWQATELADDFGTPEPDVAFQNGGGIRNASLIPAGDITLATTWDIAPFSNFVTVFPELSRETVKAVLENAVSNVENVDGRWAHVSGMSYVYDPTGDPRTYDDAGNVTFEGDRIVSVVLDDGTVIVEDGAVVAGDPISAATIDFLARGGDRYPFGDAGFVVLGATYQQALAGYIVDGLGGVIDDADYPEGGEGRITTVD